MQTDGERRTRLRSRTDEESLEAGSSDPVPGGGPPPAPESGEPLPEGWVAGGGPLPTVSAKVMASSDDGSYAPLASLKVILPSNRIQRWEVHSVSGRYAPVCVCRSRTCRWPWHTVDGWHSPRQESDKLFSDTLRRGECLTYNLWTRKTDDECKPSTVCDDGSTVRHFAEITGFSTSSLGGSRWLPVPDDVCPLYPHDGCDECDDRASVRSPRPSAVTAEAPSSCGEAAPARSSLEPPPKRPKTYNEDCDDHRRVLCRATSLVRTLYVSEVLAKWGIKIDETGQELQFASDGDATRLVRSFSSALSPPEASISFALDMSAVRGIAATLNLVEEAVERPWSLGLMASVRPFALVSSRTKDGTRMPGGLDGLMLEEPSWYEGAVAAIGRAILVGNRWLEQRTS